MTKGSPVTIRFCTQSPTRGKHTQKLDELVTTDAERLSFQLIGGWDNQNLLGSIGGQNRLQPGLKFQNYHLELPILFWSSLL